MSLTNCTGDNTLVVFSHPNHELAVYGWLQHIKPHLVYLTDGGGAARVDQTRQGLTKIGLLEKATFLNHSEASFYQALLDTDATFFRNVAGQVRVVVERTGPNFVFCDAVEFYNPVHDMSLPIVKAAVANKNISIYEIPLVYQKPGSAETYELQRMPTSRRDSCEIYSLTREELEQKHHARDQVYTILARDMGPLINSVSPTQARSEYFALSGSGLSTPSSERVLRYEWRARLLKQQGTIPDIIEYQKNYLPLTMNMLAAKIASQ